MIINLKELTPGKCRIVKTDELANAKSVSVLYTKDKVIITKIE